MSHLSAYIYSCTLFYSKLKADVTFINISLTSYTVAIAIDLDHVTRRIIRLIIEISARFGCASLSRPNEDDIDNDRLQLSGPIQFGITSLNAMQWPLLSLLFVVFAIT